MSLRGDALGMVVLSLRLQVGLSGAPSEPTALAAARGLAACRCMRGRSAGARASPGRSALCSAALLRIHGAVLQSFATFFVPNTHHSSCNLQLQICSASDGDVVDAACPHMHRGWEGFSPRKGRSRRGEPAVKGELHGGAGMGVFQICSKARAGRAIRELTWNPISLSYSCSNTSLLPALPRHVPRPGHEYAL